MTKRKGKAPAKRDNSAKAQKRKPKKKGKLPIKDRTYPGGPKINKDGVPEDGGWAL